jgi:hypothetical protein
MLATGFSSKDLSYKIYVESLSGWKTAIFQRIAETDRQQLQSQIIKQPGASLSLGFISRFTLSSFTAESHMIGLLHPKHQLYVGVASLLFVDAR